MSEFSVFSSLVVDFPAGAKMIEEPKFLLYNLTCRYSIEYAFLGCFFPI